MTSPVIQPTYEHLQLGDIIFVSNADTAGERISKWGQIILSGLPPIADFIPTHVAIATGNGGLIIHSDHEGVRFGSVAAFINNDKFIPNVLVYRNKALTARLKAG